MTRSLALIAVVATLSVSARAADSDASRDLQNLVYYPHVGQFRLVGQVIGSLQDSGSTNNSTTGAQTAERSTNYDKLNGVLAYGIIDGLRVNVNETYLLTQKTRSTSFPSGVQSDNHSFGWSDPTISLTERLLDAPGEGFSADVAANMVPRIGRALAAGNGQTGNNVAASWSAAVSANLFYRLHVGSFADELDLAPAVTRFFGGVVSGSNQKTSTLTTPYDAATVTLTDRFHISDAWYVQAGVMMTIPYSYASSSQVPGAADATHKVDFAATPNVHVGFLATPRFLLDASVTYADQGSSAYPATGSATSAQTAQTYANLQAQFTF